MVSARGLLSHAEAAVKQAWSESEAQSVSSCTRQGFCETRMTEAATKRASRDARMVNTEPPTSTSLLNRTSDWNWLRLLNHINSYCDHPPSYRRVQ